jgi:hypothetical protein
MTIQWHSSASLLDGGQRFPVHGTIEQCVEAWRACGSERQTTAVLLTEIGIAVTPTSNPVFSFQGKALEELSATLTDERKGGTLTDIARNGSA